MIEMQFVNFSGKKVPLAEGRTLGGSVAPGPVEDASRGGREQAGSWGEGCGWGLVVGHRGKKMPGWFYAPTYPGAIGSNSAGQRGGQIPIRPTWREQW